MGNYDSKWDLFISVFAGSLGGLGLSLAADRVLGPEIPRGFFIILGILTMISLIVAAIATISRRQSIQWLFAICAGSVSFWLLLMFVTSLTSSPSLAMGPNGDPSVVVVRSTVLVIVTPVVVTATPAQALAQNVSSPETTTPTPTPPANTSPEGELTQLVTLSASNHSADSNDTCQPPHTTHFAPSNLVDGQTNSAWRVNGNGSGEYFIADFGRSVRLTRMLILPGYAKTDPCDATMNWCPRNRKPKTIALQFSTGQRLEFGLEDTCTWQTLGIPDIETQSVRVTILDSYPWRIEHHTQYTSISEIRLLGAVQ